MTRGMSIVSVVDHKMRNTVGIAGEVFSTLAEGDKVDFYLISQGADGINISLVVKDSSDARLAMNVVHTKLCKVQLIRSRRAAPQKTMALMLKSRFYDLRDATQKN